MPGWPSSSPVPRAGATESTLRSATRRWRRTWVAAKVWAPRGLLVAEGLLAGWMLLHLDRPPVGFLLPTLLLLMGAVAAATLRVGERSHLGFGAVYLVALSNLGGVLVGALCAAATSALSDRVARMLDRRFPDAPPERRLRTRRLGDLLAVALAAGIGAWLLRTIEHPVLGLISGCSGFAAALLLHEWISRMGQREERGFVSGPLADGTLMFLGGAIFVGLGARQRLADLTSLPGTPRLGMGVLEVLGVAALMALVSGLALALSAQQRRTAHLSTRLGMLDAIGSAPRRLGSPQRRQPDVVTAAIDEIRRLIDFDYLQLELSGPAGGVFSARRNQQVIAQRVTPPPYPPPRPGIHRRRSWVHAERVLLSGDTQLGTLELWCDPRRQDRGGLEVLDHLGEQVAAQLERSMLAREARFDRLTGLPRRGIFDDELQRRWRETRDEGRALAVVLIDVDHFKSVNDTHGHPVGDEVLVHVANRLAATMRDEDLCCRYGGEEFVLLLDGAKGALALEMAERARRAVLEVPARAGDLELEVTVSAGAASVPELLLRGANELVELADEALYAAKSHGRNRSLLAIGAGRFRGPRGSVLGADAARETSRDSVRL